MQYTSGPLRLAACAAMLLAVACGGGADSSDTAALGAMDSSAAAAVPPAGGTGTMTDQQVFAMLSASNAAEIAAAQLAVDSATSADVKAFAQTMLTDHRAMNEQAHQAAQQAGIVSRPGETTENVVESSRDIASELRGKARGAEFDRAFMEAMVTSHEETLERMERALQGAQAPALRDHLTQGRTKVQAHLERARAIRQQLG